jgi:hypothetical protein
VLGSRLFFQEVLVQKRRKAMTQREIIKSVAQATGELEALVDQLGFHLADPLDVNFDPEPRQAQTLDWDTMAPADWPL